MGLLRTLLVIIFVYYGLRILYRLFAPFLLRYASRKVQQQFHEKYGHHQQNPHHQHRNEGEVTIDKQPATKKSTDQKIGEYIDFEEVD